MVDLVAEVATEVIQWACDPGSTDMPSSKYERLAESIREQIRTGDLLPGAKLPSINELRAQGWTYHAIRSAMLVLRAEGLLEGRPGDGVYVREKT